MLVLTPYSKKTNKGVECTLCPNFCVLQKGQKGRCHVRAEKDGEVVLTNYGHLTNIAIDPISKKPFCHFLEDTNTLSVSSYFCNIDCSWCENFEVSQVDRSDDSHYYPPEKIVSMAIENDCPSVCMTYNEPFIAIEYLIDLAVVCHEKGLKFVVKTNGYVNKDPWLDACRYVDAINVDWKGSEDKFKKISSSSAYVLEERITEVFEMGVHLEISVPVFYSDVEEEMEILGLFLKGLDPNIPTHLLKIIPAYKFHQIISPKSMELAESILSSHLNFVYPHNI